MDEKVKQKLQALFAEYTKNLPKKIKHLEDEWAELQHHFDNAKLINFHRDVHTLCGSAGTYGYHELGLAARQLEIYLKSLLNVTKLTSIQKDNIDALLKKLTDQLNLPAPTEIPILASHQKPKISKSVIYIIDRDKSLADELAANIKKSNIDLVYLHDIQALKEAIKLQSPIAVIANMYGVSADDIQFLADLQERDTSIPLFCIIENGDLFPRLQAIRAGSTAFFQKPVDVISLSQSLNQILASSHNEKYRILIIDDSANSADYYALILKDAGMITQTINNPLEIMRGIAEFQPDLLLMDIYMPQCSGLEIAAVLRQEPRYTKIPIIFLSSEADRLKQLAALSLGGDDFLTKPILAQHLISAVKSRAKRASILNYYMSTDSLTGLLNHTNILQRLENEIAIAERQERDLSFIMIDVDHFKDINDAYGHSVGDLVLRKLSNLLFSQLRKRDSIGRYGGEEFAIILPGMNMQNSIRVCNTLRKQFSQLVFTAGEKSFSVTFSAGIATFPLIHDIVALTNAADQALYKAKAQGRNQVVHSSTTA